jgi:hypothetical protein
MGPILQERYGMSGVEAKCRDCDEPIVWMKTFSGKNIPVDPESVDDPSDESVIYDKQVHTTHFDTCGKKPAGGQPTKVVKSGLELERGCEKQLLKYLLALQSGTGHEEAGSAFIVAMQNAYLKAEPDYEDDIPF